jgi:hypothetical protein
MCAKPNLHRYQAHRFILALMALLVNRILGAVRPRFALMFLSTSAPGSIGLGGRTESMNVPLSAAPVEPPTIVFCLDCRVHCSQFFGSINCSIRQTGRPARHLVCRRRLCSILHLDFDPAPGQNLAALIAHPPRERTTFMSSVLCSLPDRSGLFVQVN